MLKRAHISTFLIVALALASQLSAECVEVEGKVNAPRSTSAPKFVVRRGGNPVGGALIVISPYVPNAGTAATVLSTSDKRGILATPRLAPGTYRVSANDLSGNHASMLIEVSRRRFGGSKSFTMDLQPAQGTSGMTDAGNVREFVGSVNDPTGAVIGARIVVAALGNEGQARTWTLVSDREGRFATSLPEGTYIAQFYSQGFATKMVRFAVSAHGADSLQVRLVVAQC